MDFAKNFAADFAADFGSDVLSQGLSGHGVGWGQDFEDATVDAGGSSLLLGSLTDQVNPLVSGAASNMVGSFLQDRLVDGDSWSSTLENVAVSGATGAAGTHLGQAGDGVPAATEAEKIGTNTLVYTGGDVDERDGNDLDSRIAGILGGFSSSGDQLPDVVSPSDPGIST